MGKKLSKAPVYMTLAQVRFNQLLALEAYVPAIQERLRKAFFPDFQKIVVQTFNLHLAGAQEAQNVPVSPTAQYLFSNIEKTSCFVLQQNGLTFQTTEYDVFESFSASLLQGLTFVDDEVGGLSYCER